MAMVQIVVALLLAFVGMVVLAPIYIGLLQRLGFGKQIRPEGPSAHYGKAGTPTMGGMLIIGVVLFLAMALRIEDVDTLTPMLALVGVGILGAIDDFVNVRWSTGMRGRWKLVWQTIVAVLDRHQRARSGRDRHRPDPLHPVRVVRHRRRQQRGEPH
jgi:phospho-N-acetylmuramoyl-pentapeptide-transferase